MNPVSQGAGQALGEDVIYDRESGQLVTGSLLDYRMPRADDLPTISVDFSPVPSLSNALGIKGVGEGGTVAATPTVMTAILDALRRSASPTCRCRPPPSGSGGRSEPQGAADDGSHPQAPGTLTCSLKLRGIVAFSNPRRDQVALNISAPRFCATVID